MKVIEDNFNKPRKITCSDCKSILEYEESDVRRDIDGDTYIECPLCGRWTYL